MPFFLDSASFGHEDVAFRRLKILEIDKFWEMSPKIHGGRLLDTLIHWVSLKILKDKLQQTCVLLRSSLKLILGHADSQAKFFCANWWGTQT